MSLGTLDQVKELEEEIVILENKLKVCVATLIFYASGQHLWAESGAAPEGVNVSERIGHYAKETLDFIEGKK